VTTDRYSGRIGRLSKCATNVARSLLTTITFIGERQDIFEPGRRSLLPARRRTPVLFCPPSSRPTTCRVTPDRSAGAAYVTLR
jgi:hypothetical protein